MRKILLFLTGMLAMSTAVTLWLTQDGSNNFAELMPAAGANAQAGTGEALIGGAFTLTDQNGTAVSDAQFRGKLMLVYFGFTHCPDICPISATALSKTMELLGDQADQVVPIFISVDPKRDTPAVLKNYFANFDKRFVALTGSEEDIKKAADEYKAYYSRTEPPEGEEDHAKHAAADYTIDHSGYIYLMGKDGKYIRHFSYDASPEGITTAVQEKLK